MIAREWAGFQPDRFYFEKHHSMHGESLIYRYEPQTDYELIEAHFMLGRAAGKVKACNATFLEVLPHLGTLWTACKKTGEDSKTQKQQLKLYADRLARYPLEAVLETLGLMSQNQKWWPSLGEIKEQVDEAIVAQSRDAEGNCKYTAIKGFFRRNPEAQTDAGMNRI